MEKMGQGSLPEKIIVNKFGGGILIKNFIPLMVERLREQIKDGHRPVVVISAFPGATDELLKSSGESFLGEFKERTFQTMIDIGFSEEWQKKARIELNKLFADMEKDLKLSRTIKANEDRIVAYGEKLAATIFTFYLNMLDLPAKRFLAEEIPIITDDNFKNANIVYEISEKNIKEKIQGVCNSKIIPVIPGFTGRTKDGQTTTLGRGGTDTTACFVGSALRAEKVILWKDVNGVLSTDPKIVPEAKTIEAINYQEAKRAGKIIHDKAIQYAKLFNTPLEIASITNPESKTEVISKIKQPEKGAKIISYKKDTIFLVGNFDTQHVNDFNNLLNKSKKVDLKIGAFPYKNCTKLKAVVQTDNINNVIKVLHKKFII